MQMAINLYKTLESLCSDLAVMLNFCKPLDFLGNPWYTKLSTRG